MSKLKPIIMMSILGVALSGCQSTLKQPHSAKGASAPLAATPLTIERIFSDPSLSGKAPIKLKFSPDGSRVTYLQGKVDDYNRYDLWEYNIKANSKRLLVDSEALFSGPENLSDEEKARRERQRIFGRGILEYTWSNDGKALLFPLNGDLYYYPLATGKSKKLTNTEAFETDARFSPKGEYVSFIREQNLYALHIASGKEIQLTKDGGGTIKNGMAEFVAQEEMSRMTGSEEPGWYEERKKKNPVWSVVNFFALVIGGYLTIKWIVSFLF